MFDNHPLTRKKSRYDLNGEIELGWAGSRGLLGPMRVCRDGEVAGQSLIITDLSLHAALISDKLRKKPQGRCQGRRRRR
jgi:hypothetical protein